MSRQRRTEHHRYIHHHRKKGYGLLDALGDLVFTFIKIWFIFFVFLPLFYAMLMDAGNQAIESLGKIGQTEATP